MYDEEADEYKVNKMIHQEGSKKVGVDEEDTASHNDSNGDEV